MSSEGQPQREARQPEDLNKTLNSLKYKRYRERVLGSDVEDPEERAKFRQDALKDQAAAKKLYRANKKKKEAERKAEEAQQKAEAMRLKNRELQHENRELAAQLVFQPTTSASTEQPPDQPTVTFQLLTDAQRDQQQGWLINFIQLPDTEVRNYTDQTLQLRYATNWQAYKEMMATPGEYSFYLEFG